MNEEWFLDYLFIKTYDLFLGPGHDKYQPMCTPLHTCNVTLPTKKPTANINQTWNGSLYPHQPFDFCNLCYRQSVYKNKYQTMSTPLHARKVGYFRYFTYQKAHCKHKSDIERVPLPLKFLLVFLFLLPTKYIEK